MLYFRNTRQLPSHHRDRGGAVAYNVSRHGSRAGPGSTPAGSVPLTGYCLLNGFLVGGG